MLQLICGCAGTGKTEYLYRKIAETTAQRPEQSCIVLVPEQFSFVSERQLLVRLGPQRMTQVQVLSFSRLAERVQKLLGLQGGRPMSDAARLLLLNRAFAQTVDQLPYYQRYAGKPAVLQTLLAAMSECRQCAITPMQLETAAEELEDDSLRQKTRELGLLMSAFEAIAAPLYTDPQEALTLLLSQLNQSRFFDGAAVFADAFSGFTEQEYTVLGEVMRRAESLSVTLCTDTLRDATKMSRFSTVIETAHHLTDLAARHSVPVPKPVYLTEACRFARKELLVLSQGALVPDAERYDQPAEAVTVTPCADVYEESRFAARTVRRLLRQGFRAREIAVVARNLSAYSGVLDAAFSEMGVPYYFDSRHDVLTDPLPTVLLSALRCALDGFQTESLLRLMKTGLLGISPPSVAKLEDYAYIWNLNGSAWKEPWTAHPDGFVPERELSEEEHRRALDRLAYLNLLRRRLMKPLLRLRSALSGRPSGHILARALYDYLIDARIDRMTRVTARLLQKRDAREEADRMARLWDVLIGLLDDVELSVGDQTLLPEQAVELLRMALTATDIGAIPQQIDAVQVGSADRMRFSAPKVVLVLGANEGVFPRLLRQESLFSDRERRLLTAQGLPLTEDSDGQNARERFYVYTALSAASEALFVSYLTGSGENGQLTPSVLPLTVKRLLPHSAVGTAVCADGSDIETAAEAFERMAQARTADPPLWAALHDRLLMQPEYERRVRTADRVAEDAPLHFDDAEAAARFFGKDMTLSASQIEKYYLCRFQYFCRYKLKLQQRERAEMNALQFGNVLHAVMQTTLPRYVEGGVDTVERTQVFDDARQAARHYVQENMGGLADKPPVFRYRLEQLSRVCGEVLWHTVEELRQSAFMPADYELPIRRDEGLPPVTLTLPDGTRVRMEGKIDRVDVYQEGDTAYVRVIDYKTGQKDFKLSEVVQGLNLQMLIYLMTVWQNGGTRYGEVLPAGMLYMPARLPIVAGDDLPEEKRRAEQMQKLRMNGLLLDDPRILQAMEADVAGVFIPTGTRRKNVLISLRQFGILKQRAEQLLSDMAETLRRGDIDALPADTGKTHSCAYCPYADICGHEEGGRQRLLIEQADELLFTEKENENGHDITDSDDCGDCAAADGGDSAAQRTEKAGHAATGTADEAAADGHDGGTAGNA